MQFFYKHGLGVVWSKAKQDIHHTLVGHGGHVSDVAVTDGDLPQHASHDLPGAGLGQPRRLLHEVRLGEGAYLLSYCNTMATDCHSPLIASIKQISG